MIEPELIGQVAPSAEALERSAPAPPPLPTDHDPALSDGLRIAYRTLRSFRSLSREDAEDLSQQVAMTFLLRRDQIQQPEAWFFTCAREEALSLLRGRQRRDRLSIRLPPEEETTPPPDGRRLDCQRLYYTLGERCRKLLGSLYLDGQSLRDVAGRLGRPLTEVFRQKQRCIKTLQSRLTPAPEAPQ